MPDATPKSLLKTGTGSQRHAGSSDEIPGRQAPLDEEKLAGLMRSMEQVVLLSPGARRVR
jgi:hypothetical protein